MQVDKSTRSVAEHRESTRCAQGRPVNARDAVLEAGLESFPASDAPAWGKAAESGAPADTDNAATTTTPEGIAPPPDNGLAAQ